MKLSLLLIDSSNFRIVVNRNHDVATTGINPLETMTSRGIARVIIRLAAIPPTSADSTLAEHALSAQHEAGLAKLADLTHFAGTMHLAPSNLVASLAPSLAVG